jgi:HTH-type transcriptional regulator/antitoxin HigA
MELSQFSSPGEFLEHLLKEKGWTQSVFAAILDMEQSVISKYVTNKRPITAEFAIAVEEVLATSADALLTLQKSYELANARRAIKPNLESVRRAQLFGGLPVPEMIKRGWLSPQDIRDVPSVERALIEFFGVKTFDEIEVLPHAAKKTDVAAEASPAQLAWLYRVRQIAREMIVGQFSPFGARRAIEQLKQLTLAAEETRKVPRILSEHGIRFVIVETLPKAKIDGVCFWLSDDAPVIGMTLRYDRIDNFWFVLRHELEHVLQGHGKSQVTIDYNLEGERAGSGPSISEEERVANLAASEFSVPRKTMDSFIARKSPFFAERDILGLAATLRVHPGLVAGQLQHLTGRYDKFRSHLVPVRKNVAPSAIVDGWGDVAPIGP